MKSENHKILGIDLGTTYSCAAIFEENKARVIPSGKGYLTIPSVVGVSKKGDIVVGTAAADQMVLNPEETIYGSKRLIGRKFKSPVVQQMLKTMTYKIVEGENEDVAVVINKKKYTMTDITSFILAEVKDMVQGQLNQEITRAVITVPAYYNDNQRHAVVEAGKKAGFFVERIVNEPTAAALSYGFNKKLNQTLLVYDLGGGTFDVSVLKVQNNRFRVLATGGNHFLGGLDFDTRVTEHIVNQFQTKTGKDLHTEKIAYQRLRAAVEHAKRTLSEEMMAKISLSYLTEVNKKPTDLTMQLKREELEELTGDLVDQTIKICEETLNSIDMPIQKIDDIILVGGQTRMPLVAQKVEEYFNKPPRKGVHPDEVVALGAALLGNTLLEAGDVQLEDVLSIPIGIALPSGQFKIILERNAPVPSSKSFKLTLHREETIEIDIHQGVAEKANQNEYLGSFLFPPPPKSYKGNQILEMKFELSPECLLTVQAKDLQTGQVTSARMKTISQRIAG